MSYSRLPLSYCTNVHPGVSVGEVMDGLERYTAKVREKTGSLAAGLWLARPVVSELLGEDGGVKRLGAFLKERGLACYTLNAFPYGNFHDAVVKAQVYLPDWSDWKRLLYTLDCAAVLAGLMEEGVEGSISTLPVGFKGHKMSEPSVGKAVEQLIACARGLGQIEKETGKLIRLAIEPEPMCILETTAEAIAFFKRLWEAAGADLELVRRHLGLCYDVCHQAVEFEDVGESIRELDRAGIRINKVHVSCAIELSDPARNEEGRRALDAYAEPRYLHQVLARGRDGSVFRAIDLRPGIAHPQLDDAAAWRIHFHVPVDAQSLGPLGTTREALVEALGAVGALDYAPHLEVETYTWGVMPGGKADLVEGLAREVLAARAMLERITPATP